MHSANVPEPPKQKLQRNAFDKSFNLFSHFTIDEDQAARKIQSAFRGFLLRRELQRIMGESKLSGRVVRAAMNQVAGWYRGWLRQFAGFVVLVFAVVTIHYQIFNDTPSVFNTDSSFLMRMESASEDLNEARDNVVRSEDLYEFMRELLLDLGDANLPASDGCLEALRDTCPFDLTTLQTKYGNSADALMHAVEELCPSISSDSGYIDSFRRVVGTVYVTQTRRLEEPCTERAQIVDPYVGANIGTCLSNGEEAKEFIPRPPHTGAECPLCTHFDFHAEQGVFAYALTGSAINLPMDFMQCRINELESKSWLDTRTKKVCFLVILLDMQSSGRLLTYSECFTFEFGGRVDNVREVTSVSLLTEDKDTVLALTITYIFFIVWHQFRLLRHVKRHYYKFTYWLRFGGTCIELTSNALYLAFMTNMIAFRFHRVVQKQAFFDNSVGFFDDFASVLDATEQWRVFTIFASIGLFARVMDVFTNLNFHPSTAVVGGVIQRAAFNLYAFAMVFFMFTSIYAFAGMVLFSRTYRRFHGFASSFHTVLFLALGYIEEVEQEISNPLFPERINTFGLIYMWIYVCLGSLLLMHVLVAILVGAYGELYDDSVENKPMFTLGRTFVECSWFMAQQARALCVRLLCSSSRRGATLEETPLERVKRLRRRCLLGGIKTTELRTELSHVFYSPKSVELVISRCRTKNQQEKLRPMPLMFNGLVGFTLCVTQALTPF